VEGFELKFTLLSHQRARATFAFSISNAYYILHRPLDVDLSRRRLIKFGLMECVKWELADAWERVHRLDLVGQEKDRNDERVIHNRSRLLGKENNALDNWLPGIHNNNAKIKYLVLATSAKMFKFQTALFITLIFPLKIKQIYEALNYENPPLG